MSDKPIHAEIINPSALKVGDVILCHDGGRTRFRIDGLLRYKDGSVSIWEDRVVSGESSLTTDEISGFIPHDIEVARILPEPVEVRDQWLVEYIENGMAFYVPASDRNHAIEVSRTINGATSILCERMSVISREEVKL